MSIALVAIAKNEELYLDEWITYHLKLGFDQIFIYNNGLNWISGYGASVQVIDFPGEKMQLPAYMKWIKDYGQYYDWAAFIDIDEFIVFDMKGKTFRQFMSEWDREDSIGLNWYLFGDNGLTEYDARPVVERFTRRQSVFNKHIKTICRPKNVIKFITPHHMALRNSTIVTPDKRVIGISPYNHNAIDVGFHINHYFGKTKGEYLLKEKRGRADNGKRYEANKFDEHNFNEVEDLRALNHYIL